MHSFHIKPEILETRRDHYQAIETLISNPDFIRNYLSAGQESTRNLVEVLQSLLILDFNVDNDKKT